MLSKILASKMGSRKAAAAGKLFVTLATLCVSCPFLGVMADKTGGGLKLTEEALKQYDGTDAEKPIYLAIDGTIFDVSASPAFYGPGGHYHHFVGKDASRAWVTQCWDSEDQLTWRMDDVEEMFMPNYLDEQLQQGAAGNLDDIEGAAEYGVDELTMMAKTVMGKLGKISEREIQKRRKEDTKEAKQSVQDSLAHWKSFFSKNDKYTAVGTVVLDKDKPEAPKLCTAAQKKRPMKGGKLDKFMQGAQGGAGGSMGGEGKEHAAKMPEFVKDALGKQQGESHKAQVKDEL